MFRDFRRFVVTVMLFCLSVMASPGCKGCDTRCEIPEKTVAQCQQELPKKGVYCFGTFQSVEYYPVGRKNSINSVYRTLLRFQNGSSCLTDSTFDPSSVNGMMPGTPVVVFWDRKPIENVMCYDDGDNTWRWRKLECGYIQTLALDSAESEAP